MAAQSRTLRNSMISLAVFFALVAALLLAVPGLRAAAERITDADLGWVAARDRLRAALVRRLRGAVRAGLRAARAAASATRLSLSELAVNSVVSVSGLAGIALGRVGAAQQGRLGRADRQALGADLRAHERRQRGARSSLIGVPMWLGLLPGSRNPLLTLLPAAVALGDDRRRRSRSRRWARRRAPRGAAARGRAAIALVAVSGGVEDALRLIRRHDWRLLGAVGYWLFDIAGAVRVPRRLRPRRRRSGRWRWPTWSGMLANSLPIPGGFVAVEGGLVGMLAAVRRARPARRWSRRSSSTGRSRCGCRR